MAVEDVAGFLGVLEDLGRLPPDHPDLAGVIDQVVVVDEVLEVLVALRVALEMHRLVEQRQAPVDDLVPQVIDYRVPDVADRAR